MLTRQSIKTLIGHVLVQYHKGLLQEAIDAKVATHYDILATNTTNGHMTTAQVAKLEGIAAGAEVNQNALASVKVGTTVIAAGNKQDAIEIVQGDHMSVTADAAGKTVTIAGAYEDFTSSTNGLVPASGADVANKVLTPGGWKILQDGTTAQKGIVQLNDAIDSESITQAATANAVKKAVADAKSYADQVKSSLLGDAPAEALDTLKELGDALGNNPDFAATVTSQLATKAADDHKHTGAELAIGAYAIADSEGEITTTDSIAVAIGKVEKKVATLQAGTDKWSDSMKLTLDGAVTGSVSFDGSQDVTLNATLSNLASNKVTAMTEYVKATTKADVATTDSLNVALGKVEYKVDSITLESLHGTGGTATLSNYGITDAYTTTQGTALEGRVATVEDTLNNKLGGVEDVTDADITDIIDHIKANV